jgi:hypothetical protein
VPSSLTQFTCMVQWPSVYIRLETEFLKFIVFWDVLPCSKIDVDRRFRGACCLHHQGDPRSPEYETGMLTTRPRRSIPALKMETICSSRNVGIYLRVYTRQNPKQDQDEQEFVWKRNWPTTLHFN